MKYILLLLLSFNLLTLYANELSARVIDNYYLDSELKRLEYLNNITKINLKSVNNDFSQTDMLTYRNSRVSDIIDENLLSSREKEVLNKIDYIATELIEAYTDINCATVATSLFNDINITVYECLDVDFKTENFYRIRPYDFVLPQNGSLNTNINGISGIYRRISKTTKDTEKLYGTLKHLTKDNIKIKKTISKMLETELSDYCDKILLETNLLSKESIAQAIVKRAIVLGNTTIRDNCDAYTFNKETTTYPINTEAPLLRDETLALTNMIADLTTQINSIQVQIDTIDIELDPYLLMVPPIPGIILFRMSVLVPQRAALVTQQNDITALQIVIQDRLNNIIAPPGGSIEPLPTIVKRARENYLFKKINMINILQKEINRYILDTGKIPSTSTDIISFSEILGINNWPSAYSNNSQILFTVDRNNFFIKYTNIGIPNNNDIKELFINNIGLKQNALIDNVSYDMIIPLDYKTSLFIEKMDSFPAGVHFDDYLSLTCDNSRDTDMLYDANGDGGFNIFQCKWVGGFCANPGDCWEPVSTFNATDNENRMNQLKIRGKVSYTTNGTTMNKNIHINDLGNIERVYR